MPLSKKMTAADVAWLRMESAVNPMTISGVLTTNARMSRQQVIELFEERLLPFQRFRMSVDDPTARRPRWVLEDPFDIERHIIPYVLEEPGDQDALEHAVSDLMSTPLSFGMPPWTVHHIESYGKGSAMIVRLHHCIADGIAVMHVLLSMSDEMWDADVVSEQNRPRKSSSSRSRKAMRRSVSETKRLISSPSHLVHRSKQLGGGTKSLAQLLTMRPDSTTMFKGAASPRKRAAWSKPIALDMVKSIANSTDSKINDVLTAVACGALNRYLSEQNEPVESVEIRTAVPFNVRPLEKAHELGNAFALVFLALPVGLQSTRERLAVIKQRMNSIKNSSEPAVVFGILQSIGFAPHWVHNLVVKMFSSKCSAVMTNVPGPQQQLHFKGIPIEGLMFWVPQAGDIGLGLSILSLNGEVLVGVSVNANLVPDPNKLVAAFEKEFDIMAEQSAPVEQIE